MKKLILMTAMLVCGMVCAMADKQAEIKFDLLVSHFGKVQVLVDENGYISTKANGESAVVVCVFTFTNVGDAPLVINQAMGDCGCTVPEYTKTPIQPGEKGTIKVTYNGSNKFPSHVRKRVTVQTNGVVEMTRIYIEGDMEVAP